MHVAMEQFHPDASDDVRRAYLVKGPTKPFGHKFPHKSVRDKRRFVEKWLSQNDWLSQNLLRIRGCMSRCPFYILQCFYD